MNELASKVGLSEREEAIYDIICDNPSISIDEIAEKFDVTRRTILRDVQELKKKEKVTYNKKDIMWKVA